MSDLTHGPVRPGGKGTPSAALPALLLPVRLETRFMDAASGSELWVRIYPDRIQVDTHEPGLTDAEVEAGRRYWEAAWPGPDSKPAWVAIAGQFGPRRAAWVVEQMTPTNLGSGDPAPSFGNPDSRLASWSRAPRAACLPDAWTVCLYTGETLVHSATGSPITKPLAVGPDPQAAPAGGAIPGLDEGMRWLVDFDQAVEAGMALKLPISAAERRQGFDRVLVYGLAAERPPPGPKTRGGPASPGASELVAALLEAHHYTDGLAFVAQGAATNNTREVATPYSSTDPGFGKSYAVERGPGLQLGDAAAVAAVLGVDPTLFAHVEGAERTEQLGAFHMARALWPTTLGYYLRQLAPGVVGPTTAEELRSWFLANARARGPLPALRVGPVPYGLLPATSLALWNPGDQRPLEQGLADFLGRLRPAWAKSALDSTPRVDPSSDPDRRLLGILGMDASSRSARVRFALGEDTLTTTMDYLTLDGQAVDIYWQNIPQPGRATLARFGYGGLDPTAVHMGLSTDSYPVLVPAVQAEPLSESEGLTPYTDSAGNSGNYISWLASASVDDIRANRYPGGSVPTSLLYELLRQAVLQQYSVLAIDVQVDAGLLEPDDRLEPELVDMDARKPTKTAWRQLDHEVPGVTPPGQPIKEFLHGLKVTGTEGTRYQPLGELWDSLEWLARLPSAELERLFAETLDLCSHRLDAWISAFANQLLLGRLRGDKRGSGGVHVGGYGWLEDLRPESARPQVKGGNAALGELATLGRAGPIRQAHADNGGFIHAASLAQAQAGAVLRNGYLSRRAWGEGQQLAIDLSSERVRLALTLIDGVRQGQPLGALLGYRVERRIHDLARERILALDRYIQPLRDRFPLVANKLTQPSGPVESVAAANVVDGLALQRQWAAGGLSWQPPLPAAGTPEQQALALAFDELTDAHDALADLSVSESVYQVLRGNYERSGGLLDALSRGEYAPDPEIVQTPRTGKAVTHRIGALVLGDPAPAFDWGLAGKDNPRATAEPRLDAWASRLLPDPSSVSLGVVITDAQGTVQTEPLTLDQLHLSALDLLALADAGTEPAASELELRIVDAVPAAATAAAVKIDYSLPAGSSDVSVPKLLVCARSLRDLIGGARALRPEDLFEPERQLDAADEDLEARAQAALGSAITLQAALADINASAASLEDALRLASYYGLDVLPIAAEPHPQALEVAAALQKRLDAAAAASSPAEKLSALFGRSFVVLPRFAFSSQAASANAAVLEAALAASESLLDQNDPLARERWLQQLSHVRRGAARYDDAWSAAQLLGRERPQLTLGQLPPLLPAPGPQDPPDRWLALDFADQGDRVPASGRTALALELLVEGGGGYDPSLEQCGLLFDEWTERIPNAEETTGVTFHYEEPAARAPQVLLLALSPDGRPDWDDEALQAVLTETLELVRIRTVDLDSVQLVGQLLPALYLPFNPSGEAVGLDEVVMT